MMLRALVLLGCLYSISAAGNSSNPSGSCKWQECRSKTFGAITGSKYCETGYVNSGQTKDCGVCILAIKGNCAFGYEQSLCCPSTGKCRWYDAICNWAALMEFFEDTGEDIQESWGKLSENVQGKCTTAAKFATMTKEEIEKVPANVLSSLKSVKGMTKEQFNNVKSKMVAAKLSSKRRANFLVNLANESVVEALESLSDLGDAAVKWPQDQVTRITNRLSQIDVWGPVSKWKSAQVDKLGDMIEGLSNHHLVQLPGDVLSTCTHTVKLRANQLGGLGESMYNMTATSFDRFLIAVHPATLGKAMMNIPDQL